MKVILLCGGAGVRFDQLLPKPLNLIHGRPMIFYTIDSLMPLSEVHIFYFKGLDDYGFRAQLINQYATIRFLFYPIPYQTRGPVETMLLGLKAFPYDDESILFLDNDNVYSNLRWSDVPSDDNVLFSTDHKTDLHHYCFLRVNEVETHVVDVKERVPISSRIGAGGYGFASKALAVTYGTRVMHQTVSTEPYMSMVFQEMIADELPVRVYHLPDHFSIGTPSDVLRHQARIPRQPLTIVCDLDNTLVTYPNEYKDYRTVEPYPSIVSLLRQLHDDGHRIIIHTARRMVTCKGDVDEVKRQVGAITEESLAKWDIPYDELIFGKPYGDVYIDDKAYNPFDPSLRQQIGFFDYSSYPDLSVRANRYHRLIRTGKHTILKLGADLDGEQFFYQKIHLLGDPFLLSLFPALQQSVSPHCLALEYIRGTPLNQIYSEGLLQPALFDELLSRVTQLHSVSITSFDDGQVLTSDDIKHHYLDKFEERSKRVEDFPFDDREVVYGRVKAFIEAWVESTSGTLDQIVSVIHGDCWFSNILYGSRRFYFVDMRGKVYHTLTTKGHAIYDWAKLYQSVVGLDHILQSGEPIPDDIRTPIEAVFWERCPFSQEEVRGMTSYLLYNTFHSYPADLEPHKRALVWENVRKLLPA